MKSPAYVWRFKSSSGTHVYETIRYDDGSHSCDCPGWCKRPIRSCKHTRAAELGDANSIALSHGPVGSGHVVTAPVATATKPALKQGVFSRKFV